MNNIINDILIILFLKGEGEDHVLLVEALSHQAWAKNELIDLSEVKVINTLPMVVEAGEVV